MGVLVLDIVLVGLAAVIGAGAGWFLRGDGPMEPLDDLETEETLRRIRSEAATARDSLNTSEQENMRLRGELDGARMESSRAKQALAELYRVAASMAANVDQHSRNVMEVSEDLTEDAETSVIINCVEKLVAANNKMQVQLQTAERELERKQKELASQLQAARTDSLTGLANRRAFDKEMAKCQSEFEQDGTPVSLLILDVDHFKRFNDSYGHQAGDEVLRGVARVLTENAQSNEVVCRYGGEEFCVVFPGRDVQAATQTAERMRTAIGEAVFEHEGQELRVTASGGMAGILSGERNEQTYKRADDALYVGKESGRDCGYWHDGSEMHLIEVEIQEAAPEETAEPYNEIFENDPTSGTDVLTGLPSCKPFMADVNRRVAALRRGGPPLTVLLLRIDRLEEIRSEYGGVAVDRVVKNAAQLVQDAIRETDHLARFDADELALLLPDQTIADSEVVAERIREVAANSKVSIDSGLLQFTVSQGLTDAAEGESAEAILARARKSVEVAYADGGNQFRTIAALTT